VITGLALILTLHIMAPVATEIYSNYQTRSQTQPGSSADGGTVSGYLRNFSTSALPVIRSFLHDHADERNRVMFRQMSQQLSKRQGAAPTSQATFSPEISQVIDDLTIQAPAFILTELTQAFQIGFLIFVPFLVVDLVVSSILLSMGMHMLSPTTISLPLKLLLFVAIDGWTLILRGLALGYAR
jgi:type III secretion protein R